MTIETTPYVLTADIYADIKNVGPVGWVEMPDGLRAVMVTDYAAIKEIGTHPDVSRDAAAHWPDLRAGNVPADSLVVPWVTNAGPFSAYGAEHRRLKKLMTPAFTQRQVDKLEPMIHEIVAGALAEIAPGPHDGHQAEPMDLRAEFCFPVPIRTIGAVLGVDVDDEQDLFPVIRAGADALFDTNISREELGAAFVGLLGAIDELIARKRANPDGSLTSTLIQANEDGDTYTATEIAEVVRILIVAGYETTVNLLDQCIFLLLTHPQYVAAALAEELGSDAAETAWGAIIDEALRHSSPANVVPMRFPVKDIVIAGFEIPAGTPLLVSFAGAGRDAKVHEAPDVFDPTRTKKDHLGFGYGPHRCPGAAMAIAEAKIALPALFSRYRLTLVEDPAEIPANDGIITNGHARLLVTLEPND
ncbi:Cytochrome P450 [Promicromonospora umidemergens]|uniref:Cytochrome P450 n=1 Tax=Promicromonospora umidemergens TaxID=629679 RepID=A0ABP8XFX3_9MICO|nr:cytochrome P450 [Promicromonospora umidemergens]MCP2282785.1 Cytochrome P450 [Promicromonospora umidemergens]